MCDILPFPETTEKEPEKQIEELVSYLISFKESLEFALSGIEDRITKLSSMSITVEDVVASSLFTEAVDNIVTARLKEGQND